MIASNNTIKAFARFIGLESNKTGHLEKWLSAVGGLVGIVSITLISRQFLDLQAATWVVASMGATAVLVFAVPHGPLSQPWPVLAGHCVSAIIGVACARWIPDALFAAGIAVAVAIGCMHYLRCIHPPGGATALSAVIGGSSIQALGFQFVLTPVLLNAATMVVVSMAFNYAFRWRRYPASLAARHTPPTADQASQSDSLNASDLEKALLAMNSTIDISGQDLADIYRLAQQNKQNTRLDPAELELGHYYSNGQYGADWQVRQIIDMATPMTSPDDLLIYKVVAGSGRRSTGSLSFDAFAQWARYEVYLNENSWQRKEVSSPAES